MTLRVDSASRMAAFALALTAVATCTSNPTDSGNQSISDPSVFEAEARASFAPIVVGLVNAAKRLLVAVNGGAADGVVIVPVGNGANAALSIDFDGDGSREGSLSGTLVGNVATGAQLTIAAVGAKEPSLNGGGSMLVTQTSPGMVVLDNIAGSGGVDPDGSRNAAEVAVVDGSLAVDLVAGVPTGFMDLEISGENRTLSITVTFEANGQGGFRLRFTGSGLNFTIP